MGQDAESFVAKAKELPVMPPVAAEVMKKAEDPETDLKSISTLISRDAALAVRVLKIANSSFYSMPRRIDSIQQAIVLLGYSTLRSVVVAAAIKDVFSRFGLAERLLWEHGVAGGVGAALLAQQVGGIAREEAFVGGLVHDIGKLVIYSQAQADYQKVLTAVYSEEKDSVSAETEVFGFDHTQVGRLVLHKWRLPESLAAAVGAHHDLERAGSVDGARPLAAVLMVADRLCLREGIGRRKSAPELDPFACPGGELLGLTGSDIDELAGRFVETYEEERKLFG
ncbi:MAG: HDOD domain-containing protein [Myxococcota bacterium]